MNGAIAIFVKTPGFSAVKSRLADERGEHYALDWYAQAAAAVASVARLAQARFGVTAYWAVAERAALHAWPGLPVLEQGEGDLGTRMAHVHVQLVERHGAGLLLGADAPQLTAHLLGEAIAWVSAPPPRLVLGPATDGGFWLFGGNVTPALSAWTSVRYSAISTAHDLVESMQDIGEWLTLATLTDVDHARDLHSVLHALEALPEPTSEQRALAARMREHDASPSVDRST